MATIHIYAPLCIAAGAIFPPVCATLVALRFHSRKMQKAPLGWDDWLTIPPLLLLVGMCIAVLYGIGEHAVGYRSPPLPPGKTIITVESYAQTTVRSVYWSIEVMQVPALGCLKASLILFYRRIFHDGLGRPMQVVLDAALALTVAWTVAFQFVFILICHRKVDAYWTTLLQEKQYCLDTVMIHDVYGVTDVVLDLIVILLPLPMVFPLRMPWHKKVAVCSLFVLGALSIVASAFRMVTYLESTKVEFEPGTDTLILITGGIYWSLVECGLALICCCLPTLQGTFRKHALPAVLRATRLDSILSSKTARGASYSSSRIGRRMRTNSREPVEFQRLGEAERGASLPWSVDRKTEISVTWSNRTL